MSTQNKKTKLNLTFAEIERAANKCRSIVMDSKELNLTHSSEFHKHWNRLNEFVKEIPNDIQAYNLAQFEENREK